MSRISEAKVLIVATDGFEESELFGPLQILRDKGAEVNIDGSPLDDPTPPATPIPMITVGLPTKPFSFNANGSRGSNGSGKVARTVTNRLTRAIPLIPHVTGHYSKLFKKLVKEFKQTARIGPHLRVAK